MEELYKTISDDNLYCYIVHRILETHSDVIFLYAGYGDDTRLLEVKEEFPDRVFHIGERADLYQIMKHITLYLNTYPIMGGLMTQYAAICGKLPITLKNKQISDGFLLNEDKTGIFYDNSEDLLKDVDRLLNDDAYRMKKEEYIAKSILKESDFEESIRKLLFLGRSDYKISYIDIDDISLKEEY